MYFTTINAILNVIASSNVLKSNPVFFEVYLSGIPVYYDGYIIVLMFPTHLSCFQRIY